MGEDTREWMKARRTPTVNAKQLEKFVWLSEDNPTEMIH